MNKTNIVLICILLLGLLLRIIDINNSPPALYGDELTITLDANSLLQTGRDQLGNTFPLTFRMGAGRPPGYVYGSIPFVAIFGPSALGVRMLSILSGLGIIVLLYYIGKKLFSSKIGLSVAFIAAVSPWDISLSRGGFEAHLALFLVLLGLYLFLKAKEKPLFYLFSALSFGLTLHTYPTYKVSLLLFIPLLIWFQGLKNILAGEGKKYFSFGVILLVILGLVSLSQTFVANSEIRFQDINIFSQKELKSDIEQKINLERNITDLSQTVAKYFHNKPVEYAKVFGENYLQNFSMDFLFIHGDRNPRHNMATIGGLYTVEIILLGIGVLNLWQMKKKVLLFLLVWVALAPIPTAIVDLPHGLRSSFMLPPLLLLSALGLTILLSRRYSITLSIVVMLFAIQFIFFIQKLYFLAPGEYGRFWSYSAKLASDTAIQNKNQFDYIIISDKIDAIEYAYPVYARVNPALVISQNNTKSNLGSYQVKKFDNVYLGNIPQTETDQFISNLPGSVLFIGPSDMTSYLSSYETIKAKYDSVNLVLKKILR